MRRPPSPKPDFGASQDTDENFPGAKGVKHSENLDKKPNHGANVFQCSGFGDCHMVFTRSEHLARHVRKHTGERPFKCHCFKAFSRLDNLRQHCQTVHSDTPEKNEEVLRKLTILHSNLAASAAKNQRCFSRNAAQDNAKQIQEANGKDSPPPKRAGEKHLSPSSAHSLSAPSDAPAKERVPCKDEQGTGHGSLPSVSYHTQPYYPTNRTAPRSTNYALPVPRTISSRSSRALVPSPVYLPRSSSRPGSQSPSTLPAPNLHLAWGAQAGYGEFPKPHLVLPPLSQISASGSGERKRPTPSSSYPPPTIRDGPPVHMQMTPRRMTMPALYSSRGYVPVTEERGIYSPTYATRNVPPVSGASHSGNKSGANFRSEPYTHTLQQPAHEPLEVKSEAQNSSSLTEKLARDETASATGAAEYVGADTDFLPRMPKCYRSSYPHDQSAFNARPASSASSSRYNDPEGMFAPSYHPSRYHPMRYRNEHNLSREKGMATYASEYEHTFPTILWHPSEEHTLVHKHQPQYASADLPPKQCFTRKRKACTEA